MGAFLSDNWTAILVGLLVAVIGFLLRLPFLWLLKRSVGRLLFPKVLNSQKDKIYRDSSVEHRHQYEIKIPPKLLAGIAKVLFLTPQCHTDLSEMKPVYFSRFGLRLNGELIDLGPRIDITSRKFDLMSIIEKSKKYNYQDLYGQTVPVEMIFFENMNISDLKNSKYIDYLEDNSEPGYFSIILRNTQNFDIYGLLVKKDFNSDDRITKFEVIKEGTPFLPFSISIERRNLSSETSANDFWDGLKTGDLGIASITCSCTIDLKRDESVEIKICYTK